MKIANIEVELLGHYGSDLEPRTKTHKKIVEAYNRGYRMVAGKIQTAYGNTITPKLCGTQRYPTFTVNFDKEVYGIPFHQFAAYCYYGGKLFDKSLVVRHLDGDVLNLKEDNIKLGTHSENNLDKSEPVRIAAAKKARAAQGTLPKNAKLTDDQVQFVRDFYSKLNGKKAPNGVVKALGEELRVTRTTLNNIKKGTYYASSADRG